MKENGYEIVTCLEKVKLSIRDAHLQLKDSLGLRIIPSTAKSHEERGRVERKIRTLRDMLKKVAVSTSYSLTPMQWETVFAKLASEIDDIPMAKADKTSTDLGWDLLTPNRFKLGELTTGLLKDQLPFLKTQPQYSYCTGFGTFNPTGMNFC